MSVLIQSGTIITASDTFQADILVEGEHIAVIGNDLAVPPDAQVINAAGKFVLPGGIDVHTHFDLPMFGTVSSDDHYTGHKAAAFGGTTTVIDFIPQDLAPLQANVDAWHAKADAKAAIDFGFHMNISHLDEQVEAEIPGLIQQGITSLKVFTAYNQRMRLTDDQIFRVLRIAKKHGMLTMVHAENGDVIELLVAEALAQHRTSPVWHARTRPAWGAVEAVLRSASLAATSEAPLYIVHMNVAGEVDMLAYAREKGVPVMGETCPQYLFFSEDNLTQADGAKFVCSPPVRSEFDRMRLWEGLENGTIQVLSTDHCAFFFDGTKPILYEGKPIAIPGKELGNGDFTKIPNGLPGVGDRMPVFWSTAVAAGRITPNKFVELTSTNPAKIFGMYPRKGSLTPGADADILILDPNQKVNYGVALSHQRTDYNLYEGWTLTGRIEKVFLRGNLIVDGDSWHGYAGMGEFIYRKPFEHLI
ncbi:MAG: dihydropyrimidinase [Bellilinea sp.]